VQAKVDSGVWILVPAYDEAQRIGETLRGLTELYANVVVTDDGSTDHTAAVAAEYPVWILRHIANCGQGAALQTAMTFALNHGAQILVTFDADGQHCPEDVDRLVAPIRSGAVDVALGSRFLGQTEGIPVSRWLILKLGVIFTWLFSQVRVTDAHNGLRAFSRAAAEKIHISQNQMAHASEILDQIKRQRLRFCEVPVTIRYFRGTLAKGQSSWNAFKSAGQLLLGRLIR
jgi:glycosyltransferase involved in cell wall biosynthesis